MPMTCTICAHAKKADIEAAVTEGVAFRRIASRFGTSDASVRRHRKKCMSKAVKQAMEAKREKNALVSGGAVIDQVRLLFTEMGEALAIAKGQQDVRGYAISISEMRKLLELAAKLTGELDARPVQATQVNVGVSGDAPISVVIRALADEEIR